MSRLQRVVSWLLIVNGAIGGVAMTLLWLRYGQASALVTLILPIAGIASGVFYLRGKVWAGLLGLLFYAVQIVGYRSPTFNLYLQSGLYLGITSGALPAASVTRPAISINILAAVLFLLGVASLIQKLAEGRPFMKPKQAEKWAELRKKGRWSYIWRVGLLQWGLIMCGFFIGMQTVQHPHQFLLIVLRNVPIWMCAGLAFGFLTWHASERQYKRQADEQSTS